MGNREKQKRLASYQRANRRNQNTEAVQKVAKQLEELGLRAIREKGFMTPVSFYLVDFYIPKPYKLCIEVDGPYHKDRQWYDQQKYLYLTQTRGFRILRIENHKVLDPAFSVAELLPRIHARNPLRSAVRNVPDPAPTGLFRPSHSA